jgi:hypothetical protein
VPPRRCLPLEGGAAGEVLNLTSYGRAGAKLALRVLLEKFSVGCRHSVNQLRELAVWQIAEGRAAHAALCAWLVALARGGAIVSVNGISHRFHHLNKEF